MYGQQNSSPRNSSDVLGYTGSLPNVLIKDRRPNYGDFEYILGTFWIIPEVDMNDEAEVWILVGKFNNRAEWKRVFDTNAVDGNQLIKYTVLNTPGAGTFNFDSRMISAKIEVVGGGGSSPTLTSLYAGSILYTYPGAAGGYSLGVFNRSVLGNSQPYVIGAGGQANMTPGNHDGQKGGTTTFGSPVLLQATGGEASEAVVIPRFTPAVIGGEGSGGQINQVGGGMLPYSNIITGGTPQTHIFYSYGGNSFYGGDTASRGYDGEDGYAVAGVNGSGASGVTVINAAGRVAYGANGGDGLIIVTQYLG